MLEERRGGSWGQGALLGAHALALGAGLGAALLPVRLPAQRREPVLRQINLPHNYYYREMYLPQVTSGPTSPTWSPDGRGLIYSMQGFLWRQQLGDTVAEQLTTGPGYAYQPDWSPAGRTVVYSSYEDDQVVLRMLDLTTLRSTVLVRDGSVNLEPRFSPDGSRLAFVSTAFEGRFHVFVRDVLCQGREGPPAPLDCPATRLTPDVNSGLPRYYYSPFDHYLSPSWSPDGRELMLVSNRGHIWGTGGFWRMEARPDAPLREVRYEETTWRARPDWSRDGKRVVYAGYYGRQWHQLWLMTDEGGDAFQLTYGDFDATEPRWSPDSRQIAYTSNEGGNTSLWVVAVPGGARHRVEPRRRVFREPVGALEVTVVDAATGKPLPARVSITGSDARSYAPDDSWRYADDGFARGERSFEVGYFHTRGRSRVTTPTGEVTVEVTHGPEYRVARSAVAIRPNRVSPLEVRLRRLALLPGWTSGDLHVHMNYGGHYRATPTSLAFQARAEGLNLVENLIVNKEGRVPDEAFFTGRLDPVSTADLVIAHDQEFHTSYWGHSGALGLRDHLILPGYAGYVNTPAASLFPDNAFVADQVHEQGGLFGYVHPFDELPQPFDSTVPLTHELPVDAALGKVDYYEVIGFSDHLASSEVWYRLLNCGFRIPAGAGTDAMTNFASLRGPVGTNRVYVQSPTPMDRGRWLGALRAGKSFVTNGPLLQFTVNGAGIGQELTLSAGRHTVAARVWVRSLVPLDSVEVILNGRVAATVPLTGDGTRAGGTVPITVERSGWLVLRARGVRPRDPVLDLYPFASTSPIYLNVGGAPVTSAEDASFFIQWLDRLSAAAGSHGGWNDQAERREVLGHIEAARRVYERQTGE